MKRIDTHSHTYHEKLMTKKHLYIFLIIQRMFTRRVKASPKEFAFFLACESLEQNRPSLEYLGCFVAFGFVDVRGHSLMQPCGTRFRNRKLIFIEPSE